MDALTRIQSSRLNDQRCSAKRLVIGNGLPTRSGGALQSLTTGSEKESGGKRPPCAGATSSSLPCASKAHNSNSSRHQQIVDDDDTNEDFLALVMKSQRSRLEDQRTSIAARSGLSASYRPPKTTLTNSLGGSLHSVSMAGATASSTASSASAKSQAMMKPRASVTVPPDDDFFAMLQKIQSRRLDEQRSVIKPLFKKFFSKDR